MNDPSVAPLPSVTMLVIAYRMATTIETALRSALAQTIPSEIIVSDDSSGDGSLDIAASVLRDYRVHIAYVCAARRATSGYART